MKKLFKYIWFGINLAAVAVFFVFYLRFTYSLFFPPYEWENLLFVGLFLIFTEGIVESFISCANNDAKSWQCWVSLFIFSVAIAVMYLTAYQLYEPIKEILSSGESVTILLSLIFLAAEAIMSPILISKYSSWLLLGISVISEHDSKTDWILPCVLIVVNIIATVIFSLLELSKTMLIVYVCVFGVLSIISLIATINKD